MLFCSHCVAHFDTKENPKDVHVSRATTGNSQSLNCGVNVETKRLQNVQIPNVPIMLFRNEKIL